MNLNQYPEAIHAKAIEVADIDKDISQARRIIAHYEALANQSIAFDSSLKNELQRKLRHDDLLSNNADYMRLLLELDNLQRHKASVLADLERLRNEFAVAKLDRQLEIARAQESVLVG